MTYDEDDRELHITITKRDMEWYQNDRIPDDVWAEFVIHNRGRFERLPFDIYQWFYDQEEFLSGAMPWPEDDDD